MMRAPEDASRRQRLGALLVLVVGAAIVISSMGGSVPREQPLVFRLPRSAQGRTSALAAQFTKVGEAEPNAGVSLGLTGSQSRDVRHTVRLPDGDYIVSVELTSDEPAGPSAPTKTETSYSRRVTLNGHETLVVLDSKGL